MSRPSASGASTLLMREAPREREVFRFAGQRGHVGEDFGHAAMLGVEHVLHLRVAHVARGVQRPIGEAQRAPVSAPGLVGVHVRVAQSGEDLVHGVPRHAGERPPRDGVVERLRAVGKCADEPVAARLLACAQLGTMYVARCLKRASSVAAYVIAIAVR